MADATPGMGHALADEVECYRLGYERMERLLESWKITLAISLRDVTKIADDEGQVGDRPTVAHAKDLMQQVGVEPL